MAEQKPTEHIQYQQAWQEWEERIGSAKTQIRNWQLACLLSLIVGILLLVGIIMLSSSQKNFVYVAEVKPQEGVVNVQPLSQNYQPSQAQEAYMVGKFIDSIMSLPLDPVVARDHWLYAYGIAQGRAISQLNDYAQASNPFAQLGENTKTVTIKNFTALSNHSYQFLWTVTTYNASGNITGSDLYSGIFTVADSQQPTTVANLLDNPFGVYIINFSFSVEGH
jgi:type IV secretion system protein VirB5